MDTTTLRTSGSARGTGRTRTTGRPRRPGRGRTAARVTAVVAVLGCTVGGVAACTSSGGSTTSSAAGSPVRAAAAASAAPADGAFAGGASAGTADSPSVASGTVRGSAVDVAAAERARILTAAVSLGVPDVPAAVADATAAVDGAGGFVGSADTRAATRTTAPVATLVLRPPTTAFDQVLGAVSRLGTVRTSTRTEQDVTAQVADLGSRVASDRASLARVRVLFAKATSVASVIALESALTERESDLESLQAQQRALVGQVDDATITLALHGPTPAKAVVHHPAARHAGFTTGLRGGWHALSTFTRRTTVVVGALIPFSPIAVVLAALVWWRVRRTRTRPRTPPAPRPVV